MSIAEQTLEAQLQQAGIPFEREYRFAPPGFFVEPGAKRKRRDWRADFRIDELVPYPEGVVMRVPQILVEIDGGGYVAGRHSRGAGIERDCEKTSAAAILGYRVIRVTPKHVDDGRALEWIKAALGLQEAA